MRTPLLTVLLLPVGAQAQPDYLAGTPVWTVTHVCNQSGFGGGPCITTDVMNYKLMGDSTINGITYTRVERTGHVDPMWIGGPPVPPSCTDPYTYGPWPGGLVRQEGRTLRMWDGDTDVLLFDFDLQVGQNVPLSAVNGNDQIVVTDLDSIAMNGEWRRVYTINGDWSTTLIEGVGSDKGLFEPMSGVFECGYELNCFSLGGQACYPGPGPDCDLHIGLQELGATRMMLAPNPGAGPLSVGLPEAFDAGTLDVLDLDGRILARTTIRNGRSQLDIGHLPNGTYMVRAGSLCERVVLLR